MIKKIHNDVIKNRPKKSKEAIAAYWAEFYGVCESTILRLQKDVEEGKILFTLYDQTKEGSTRISVTSLRAGNMNYAYYGGLFGLTDRRVPYLNSCQALYAHEQASYNLFPKRMQTKVLMHQQYTVRYL